MADHEAFDVLAIRERLNELTFANGKRQTLVGRISDRFEPLQEDGATEANEEDIAERDDAIKLYLDELRGELAKHNLELARGEDDADQIYAVQHLRRESEIDLSWMGDALAWASRIMAVALTMVLPIVAGKWLDTRFGTTFIVLIGMGLGVSVGIWQVTQFARRDKK